MITEKSKYVVWIDGRTYKIIDEIKGFYQIEDAESRKRIWVTEGEIELCD